LGQYITFPDLLIWLPMLGGMLCFLIGSQKTSRELAFVFSLIVLGISLSSLCFTDPTKHLTYNNVNYIWLKYIGANYYIGIDSLGRLLTLLTAVSFPLVLLGTRNQTIEKANSFYGLMMLTQAGLMGVFMALDAMTFYFFWELALIPVYFLSSRWGGERRIQATFKFFVYTFAGSLLMLIGILYVYMHTGPRVYEDGTVAAHSFSLASFYHATLSVKEQTTLFALFFLAFAIKMPIFPFHTWQPDAYDQAPTSVTMVMSALMVKMGLFGVFRWLIPVFPEASIAWKQVAIALSVIGIVYGSWLAMKQDNLKKLIAYSSIAHIGLMSAALFSMKELAVQGVMVQMFNHGINIIGMWLVVDAIERKTGVKKMSELGGLAQVAPTLTIFLVVIAFANIALPLTNGFIGEFMLLGGLYQYHPVWASVAGLGVIFSAVYTLNMIQRVFFGTAQENTHHISDIQCSEWVALSLIVMMIFIFGVHPQPLINLSSEAVKTLLTTIR
jgi:NADH-quinone oxidoreductase subunit M